MRERILILVAQRADLDPRVSWVARLAAREFDVEVLGISTGSIAEMSLPEAPGYSVRDLTLRSDGSGILWLARELGGIAHIVVFALLPISAIHAFAEKLAGVLAQDSASAMRG